MLVLKEGIRRQFWSAEREAETHHLMGHLQTNPNRFHRMMLERSSPMLFKGVRTPARLLTGFVYDDKDNLCALFGIVNPLSPNTPIVHPIVLDNRCNDCSLSTFCPGMYRLPGLIAQSDSPFPAPSFSPSTSPSSTSSPPLLASPSSNSPDLSQIHFSMDPS